MANVLLTMRLLFTLFLASTKLLSLPNFLCRTQTRIQTRSKLKLAQLIPTGLFSDQVPNFLLLQSQNKLDSTPLHSPVHAGLFSSPNNGLNTAQLYSSSPSSITCPSQLASAAIVVASQANSAGLLPGQLLNQAQTGLSHAGLLNTSSNSSVHSAYTPLNFSQQSTQSPLSLTNSTASTLAITAPLYASNPQTAGSVAHQAPFVHLSQLSNQQQQQQYSASSNYFYSTLQPANRRVRVISNNLNGLTTIDDLHMHTDV